jgi:ABC-type ATPase with predicted acetyltransferase domain
VSYKVDFRDKSTTWKCKTCGKYIKTNMIIKKFEPPKLCYRCWVAQERGRGHLMRESVRSGKSIR